MHVDEQIVRPLQSFAQYCWQGIQVFVTSFQNLTFVSGADRSKHIVPFLQ
jgi:hypothetical protein